MHVHTHACFSVNVLCALCVGYMYLYVLVDVAHVVHVCIIYVHAHVLVCVHACIFAPPHPFLP